ncbi:MAG TPA: ABC transporter permease, partial [Patescibacteria group bacterium]|nr:ABC transporter permease [Patescibacteria group bacterium]
GLFGALVVLVAVLFQLADQPEDESLAFTGQLLGNFGLAVLLPVVAVIVGTAAIGSELEDGTIIYLLAKPIPRRLVAVVKFVVAWLIVVVLVCPAILLAGVVATGGDAELGLAYAVAAGFGALEYTAVFLALSLVTSRALVVGLAYVVIWEGAVAGLFEGTRILSVRQHALAVADALGGEGAIEAALELAPALVVGLLVTLVAVVIAIRRLERVELRGETARGTGARRVPRWWE